MYRDIVVCFLTPGCPFPRRVSVEFFPASQSQRTITPTTPTVVETVTWAAARVSAFIARSLERPCSPVCLSASVLPSDHPDLSAFDSLVGRLMFEARGRRRPRISDQEYWHITRSNFCLAINSNPVATLEVSNSLFCDSRNRVAK